MPAGILHIFELETHKGAHGRAVHEYQVNYNDVGNTFTGTMNEEGLKEFLTKAAVLATEVERTIEELHRRGNTTLSGIEILESEAGELGLMQEPSDA